MRVYDLFAGMGGWELALNESWEYDAVGLDFWKPANLTRAAAGLHVMDVDFTKTTHSWYQPAVGIMGSPPCQAYSVASTGRTGILDARGMMVYEPLKWHRAMKDTIQWMALEQVHEAESHFSSMAAQLDTFGYSTWVGMLNAADFGVPQSRKRCILIASNQHEVSEPPPTSSHTTLAAALPHRTDLPAWAHKKPSTTVVGSFKPEVIAAPDWRKDPSQPRQNAPNSVVTSLAERLVLQGFPPDYPVQGKKSNQNQQVGNAVPPALAGAALRMAIEGR